MICEDKESNYLYILFLIIEVLVMFKRKLLKLLILTDQRFGLKGKRFEEVIGT
jgi:hypothetical protein